MNDLPRRAVTAIAFAAVMLGGIMLHEYVFLLLMLIIHTGCLWEYNRLIRSMQEYNPHQRKTATVYTIVSGTLIFYLLGTGFRFLPYVNEYIYFLVVPLLLGYLVLELFLQSPSPLRNAGLQVTGIVYITFPLAMALFFPYAHENGVWFPVRCGLILGIVLLVWTNDTMAYFAGSLFGKHKLFPSVSPAKSWEGFAGGLIFSILTGWLLSLYFPQFGAAGWMTTGAIVSIFGTIGDLVESMIKRAAGVKDSGSFMPGHGGFLDRFDAFIFCIPFVFGFYMMTLLMK
ncbi:MAG: phosphatidate cytidylyltransferase [Chitinophagales bacterium]|nr:phosphatidate cytidylyltransferase [Chitinophagales bacterium]